MRARSSAIETHAPRAVLVLSPGARTSERPFPDDEPNVDARRRLDPLPPSEVELELALAPLARFLTF